ncbi:type VII secretion protein EccB [Microbacterium sp. ASV81]|uniref:Type VII secretion protein EccB n=1 Tax=Microbacterium capsulatum TaxID=3041921 RepID=A0ABU0XL21_9MICO|nr:type VII secretion protein EccB [Microbacterium sp. ASV81]MDQ4215268.1 type VII secretion protein EccB [Microbacterium sp. ASV81]
MATKKDLIEAQGFSRRRLLSAFTSGAPGGKELEPAKPLRAVTAGVALTAMLLLGGLFYGLLRPGLPQGWQDNRLIVATDTGARYVSIKGQLHPVINTASARLLIPAGKFSVIKTDRATLAKIPVGPAIGIVGAPDDLPAPGSLANAGWTACVDGSAGVAVSIGGGSVQAATADAGAVVRRGDDLFVISGGVRHAVPKASADAVLRAVGLGTARIRSVDGRWLNLFSPGSDFAPLVLSRTGTRIPNSDLASGDVVHVQGRPAEERYVLTADGKAAPLTPLAYQLYLLGSGAAGGTVKDLPPAQLAALPTGAAAGGSDWPANPLTPLAADAAPCALLDKDAETVLAASTAPLPDDRRTPSVRVGTGALVRIGEGSAALHMLIDGSGTAYAVPGGTDAVQRLGYAAGDVGRAPDAWIQFFPAGPALSSAAAGRTPSAASGG